MKAKSRLAKGIVFFITLIAIMCTSFTVFATSGDTYGDVADSLSKLTLQIDNPMMTLNGEEKEIDPGYETAPVIVNNRTLVPVRAIIEGLGGTVEWNEETQVVTLTYKEDVIILTNNSVTASLNGEEETLDVAPTIINNRTMFPIRYIAEGFNFDVEWVDETRTVIIEETVYVGTNEFDFEKRTVLLNNGIEMPIIGIGTFTLTQEQAENSVYHALLDGYRLIDTASAYGNEEGVGKGIVKSGVPREEIFVTTKLWPSAYNMEGIDACLEKLGLEYVDLMLLHQPMGDYIGGYKAMEQAVAEGKIRAIGVSNFTQAQFEEIMEIATIPPAINQVETHPFYQQEAMIEYLDQYGTVLESWYPLGGRGNTQKTLTNETIVAIGEAHGKTAAQVTLRWHLQAGHIAIPGSSNPDHILENISIFDFELTDEEMQKMSELETGKPYFQGFGSSEEMDSAGDRWGLDT